MVCLYILGIVKKNNSIVDVGWGMGFVLIVLYTYIIVSDRSDIQTLISALVLVWGLRLSYHIIKRNWGKEEDFRYKQWREEWGKFVHVRAFFQVYMLQGFLMLVIASPIIVVNALSYDDVFGSVVWLGFIVWILGFLFESIGDAQLRAFIVQSKNRGKLLTHGLWRYTRHPNYFGEAMMWWGIWMISLSTSSGWYGIASPVVITLLLRFVSGVPMLEKKYEGRTDWESYKLMTNAFFPWFPKSNTVDK